MSTTTYYIKGSLVFLLIVLAALSVAAIVASFFVVFSHAPRPVPTRYQPTPWS